MINNKWYRRTAWGNIALQCAIPVLGSFMSPLAAAQSDQSFLSKQSDISGMATRIYTLKESETTSSVAKKYNMSLDALRQLNQLRTFSHGFDHIGPGDELEVPLAPLPSVNWQDDKPADAAADHTQKEEKVAGVASRTGSFLANNPNSEAASTLARGMATGKASAEIQQWLSGFGTARVQLDADRNLSLKNSQLDLLLPLSDRQKRLIFTQGSIHRTDDRAQVNIGLGMRHFADNVMIGFNTFLDYDMSRNHARSGVGIEYWRDFIRLGMNGYYGLTNWKNSPDFEDYKERPANGWDICTEAYLPWIPHLGVKLNYEKYYGNEVALFGKDNRQKNPHALTAGVIITPFPLLTLSTERRQGRNDMSSHHIGAQLNYRLGVPWKHQTESTQVAAMRSLAGSRYDLVDRNNNIVLEYRKNEVIKLQTARLIKGYAGEQKSLNVSVNTKYPLARIDWSAASLIAGGGKIIANGPDDYSITLPDYQYGPEAINHYVISGIATDEKGNVSRRAQTQVTVTEAAISLAESTLTPPHSSLPADGQSQQILTLTVKDKLGHPVDIQEEEIAVEKLTELETAGATLSAFKRQGVGQYTATLTAGTLAQAITLTPTARGTIFASATVDLIANSATAQLASLTIVKDNALANGKDANQLLAVVKDANGNVLAKHKVTFVADNDAIPAKSLLTDEKGEVTVHLTHVRAGSNKITASVGEQNDKSVNVTFVADDATAMISGLEVTSNNAVADGEATNELTVRVTDANGNPLADREVALHADTGVELSASSVRTSKEGTANFMAKSQISGHYNVTATTNDHAVTAQITFIAGEVNATHSTLTINKNIIASDGKDAIVLSVTARDKNNNPVTGAVITFAAPTGITGSQISDVTEDNGVYSAAFTATQAGSGQIAVFVDGKEINTIKSEEIGVYKSTLGIKIGQ
ncbi:inverse autotransporter beta domain-containing protein [Erwinia tracheiphila]|uniref:LysM peptidoglycan-binding domain-containing protein n=1 Tax=Erwinia tracheiphila TaxID=65700 RepID=A0A345CYN6_9GAMM|nr:inverse autotransporter beta domain-containing protein [Erwinia tracheiphila]AXF78553.1 LysM peptidoglycan-binding domain-containing protein [Erwinia tracheiphila]UIA82718.1 inverse autotransporter beta domain-containing protein [Erwinia tracheiphila]UIA91301.1 inverse autotransporter beta domain-containing protein [Erwinia tracheiphila]